MLCHFLQRNHKDKTVAGNRILLEDLGATLCATSETTWNSMLDLLYVLASPSHTVSQSPDALLILFSIPLPHFIPGILNFLLFRQSKWIQLSLSTLKLAQLKKPTYLARFIISQRQLSSNCFKQTIIHIGKSILRSNCQILIQFKKEEIKIDLIFCTGSVIFHTFYLITLSARSETLRNYI